MGHSANAGCIEPVGGDVVIGWGCDDNKVSVGHSRVKIRRRRQVQLFTFKKGGDVRVMNGGCAGRRQIDLVRIDIDSMHPEFLCQQNRQLRANIAKANDGNAHITYPSWAICNSEIQRCACLQRNVHLLAGLRGCQRRLGNQQRVEPVTTHRNASCAAAKRRDKGVDFIGIGRHIAGHEEIM